MLIRIIIGLIGLVVGTLIIWRSDKAVEMFGEQQWMEKILGAGHATEGFKIIGLIIILISFLIMTNLIQGILLWFFSPIINSGIK